MCTRWAIGLALALVLVVIWPGIMFTTGYIYSELFLKRWFYLSFGWLIVAAIFFIKRPIIEFLQDSSKVNQWESLVKRLFFIMRL
ncbi:hypothetical protein [Halalkalibacter alkalisediminis]|uniref:Uncharacterized protein n=1 Tax=Halalkalibacter alkalisediminis TaxID=935616 RepID=A0ABV6NK00_9BACI|nr:hypothetical protein [Halalkalibacter alkalisediminis]